MARKMDINKRSNKNLTVGAYDYDGLAHYWAYNYGHKSTAGDRMSTSGNLVYSYSTVVAKMFPPLTPSSPPLVLLDCDPYGPTTAKQVNCIERSVSHMESMRVPEAYPKGKSEHIYNMKWFYEQALEASQKYSRARSEWRKDRWLAQFHEMVRHSKYYAEYFKMKGIKEYKSLMRLPDPSGEHSVEELKDILEKIKKASIAKRNKDRRDLRKREIEQAEKADETLKAWLNGANAIPNSRYLNQIYLRVNGAFIETTGSAKIALKACIYAFAKYSKGELKIGDDISGFTFHGIRDGIASIGCHDIPMKSIEKLLKGKNE